LSGEAQIVGDLLAAFLAGQHPHARDIRISDVRRAGSGSSSENWLFVAGWTDASGRHLCNLVLRRAPKNEIVLTAREDEFHFLKALESSPLPLPRALWMDADGRWLKRPGMVVERCEGRDDRFLLMERNAAGLAVSGRVALATEMADLLAQVHAIDVERLGLPANLRASADESLEAQVDRAAAESVAQEVEPSVELRLAEWWLRANVPAPGRKVLVHGDFRPANLLVADGRITALLDWELAFIGDPLADLGWYLAPTYRSEHFIEGHWSERDFLARYESRSGTRVDRDALRFWIVFAQFKLAVMANASMKAFLAGDTNRIAARPDRIIRPMLEMIADDRSHRRYA
jgi:aminoglycoside phosphotransferase (APT) family kinase protein